MSEPVVGRRGGELLVASSGKVRLCPGLFVLGLTAGLLGGGCSSITSEGAVGDRSVDLAGAGFGWLDETVVVAEGGRLVLEERDSDETAFHLVFSGAAFDPGVDLAALSPASRQALAEDIERHDYLALVVGRGDRLEDGDEVEWASGQPVPDTGAYVASLAFRLGHEPLDGESEYPDEVSRLASGRRVGLALERVEDERLQGTLEVALEAADADQGLEVAEGTFTVTFDVERLGERLAECNYDPAGAGAVDPCADLDL